MKKLLLIATAFSLTSCGGTFSNQDAGAIVRAITPIIFPEK